MHTHFKQLATHITRFSTPSESPAVFNLLGLILKASGLLALGLVANDIRENGTDEQRGLVVFGASILLLDYFIQDLLLVRQAVKEHDTNSEIKVTAAIILSLIAGNGFNQAVMGNDSGLPLMLVASFLYPFTHHGIDFLRPSDTRDHLACKSKEQVPFQWKNPFTWGDAINDLSTFDDNETNSAREAALKATWNGNRSRFIADWTEMLALSIICGTAAGSVASEGILALAYLITLGEVIKQAGYLTQAYQIATDFSSMFMKDLNQSIQYEGTPISELVLFTQPKEFGLATGLFGTGCLLMIPIYQQPVILAPMAYFFTNTGGKAFECLIKRQYIFAGQFEETITFNRWLPPFTEDDTPKQRALPQSKFRQAFEINNVVDDEIERLAATQRGQIRTGSFVNDDDEDLES